MHSCGTLLQQPPVPCHTIHCTVLPGEEPRPHDEVIITTLLAMRYLLACSHLHAGLWTLVPPMAERAAVVQGPTRSPACAPGSPCCPQTLQHCPGIPLSDHSVRAKTQWLQLAKLIGELEQPIHGQGRGSRCCCAGVADPDGCWRGASVPWQLCAARQLGKPTCRCSSAARRWQPQVAWLTARPLGYERRRSTGRSPGWHVYHSVSLQYKPVSIG